MCFKEPQFCAVFNLTLPVKDATLEFANDSREVFWLIYTHLLL